MLGWAAEVFYRRLMSVADDHGRFHGLPKLIRAACYPLKIDTVSDADVAGWLDECVAAGLVEVYQGEDGKSYVQIVKFGQQVRSKSKFPEPNEAASKQLIAPDINCEQVPAIAHLGVSVFVDEGVVDTAPSGADSALAETKARAVTLKTYLAECEAAGVDAIPADDATFAYAESVGLPAEFVALAWSWFKDRYGESGTGSAKRYKDWRATFRNAVRDCWPKYWAIDGQGTYYLTTAGKQAQRARS